VSCISCFPLILVITGTALSTTYKYTKERGKAFTFFPVFLADEYNQTSINQN